MSDSDFAARLKARIRSAGPISIADYMRLCNAHYYATRDPFGAAGDFTTAPEISQVFGELIGAWCADYWQRMGAPDPVLLVELGPGRGTLMADALRATRRVPAFHRALKLHLVEQSPVLRRLQQEKLAAYAPEFHDDIGPLAVPEAPMLLVANEFLDALPVTQFVRSPKGWHERRIGLAADGTSLEFCLDSHTTLPLGIPDGGLWARAKDGQVFEQFYPCGLLAGTLAVRLQRCAGAALFIDYGRTFPNIDDGRTSVPYGDTLQAVHEHRFHPVLETPGSADLTAHVHFGEFALASGRAQVHGPVTQRDFLLALGIEARQAALLKNAAVEQQEAIRSGVQRLIDPEQMGTLFKVLALTQQGGPVPAGFATP